MHEIANTDVWLYIPRAVALFCLLVSHSLTISIVFVFVPGIHSQCPIPPLFQREQGQRSPNSGARLSFVSCHFVCLYYASRNALWSRPLVLNSCEFNLKMSYPAREEVMIKLLPRNSSAHAYYTSLCCTFHACVQQMPKYGTYLVVHIHDCC